MSIEGRLDALTSAARPYRVMIRYSDGREQPPFNARTIREAESFAARWREKIGKPLISRDGGQIATIASVDIEAA